MEALVDQGLGEVERAHPGVLEEAVVEQDLMHARTGIGNRQHVLESGEKIVGVQYRVFRHLAQPVGAVAHHVGKGAHEHAHLAVKALEPADGA